MKLNVEKTDCNIVVKYKNATIEILCSFFPVSQDFPDNFQGKGNFYSFASHSRSLYTCITLIACI